MKPNCLLPLAIASLALTGVTTAAEQSPNQEHDVALSLTVTAQGDYDEVEKSNGDVKGSQTIVKSKLSNKELLQALVEEDVIDGIKGWTILLITDDQENIIGSAIYNKKENVRIDGSPYFDATSGENSLFSFKGFYDESKNEYKSNGTIQGIAEVFIEVGDFAVASQGLLEADGGTFKDDLDVETHYIKQAKLSSLVGELEIDENFIGFVTGSIKAGKGKDAPEI